MNLFSSYCLERTQSDTRAVAVLPSGFTSNGTLQIDGFGSPISYEYNVTQDNNNARTLAGFSVEAQSKMFDCPNCPYADYLKFRDYYDVFDYGDQWVQAAFYGGRTSFKNGNADFGEYSYTGRSGKRDQWLLVYRISSCSLFIAKISNRGHQERHCLHEHLDVRNP